jgi:multiple antibiotic resistance protein
VRAYEMLSAPDGQSARKEEQAKPVGEAVSEDLASYAFFPLTLPFTTGPGTIAVAVSIGTVRPDGFGPMVMFYTGATVAALAMAVVIWVSYTTADRMAAVLGNAGRQVLSRIAAFLLLGIGVQIALSGIVPVLHSSLAR